VTIASVDAAVAAVPFRWRDGERLVCYGRGSSAQAGDLVTAARLGSFVLLTGSHDRLAPADLAAAATTVIAAPSGPVPVTAAAVAPAFASRTVDAIVVVGGGRVIDAAKALAAAFDLRLAALPTTLSGAEMTAAHRPLPDGSGAAPRRPSLVVNDPALSASQPLPELAASAMNALAHAMEALYGPGAEPSSSAAAVRAAGFIARGLEATAQKECRRQGGERGAEREQGAERDHLALGALLAGYALGVAGMGLHHAVCQTIVRLTGTPHGAVNAVVLPHTFRHVLPRAHDALAPLAASLSPEGDDAAARTLAELAAVSGATRLRQLGVTPEDLPRVAAALSQRPELARPAPPTSSAELAALLEAAL